MKPRRAVVRSFWRSQLSSGIGTAFDFGVTVSLVEIVGLPYEIATALGSCTGAAINFLLGRHWSFGAAHGPAHVQAVRYGLVSMGSLALNFCGVVLLTEQLDLPYWFSKLITTIAVGVFFNFNMQRLYVFKEGLAQPANLRTDTRDRRKP